MLAVAGAVLLTVAACGRGGDGGAGGTSLGWDDLAGRTFLSSDVTKDGQAHPLAKGSTLRLTFADDGIGASGGCNQMGGAASLDGSTLVVDGPMAMTEMACAEPLMAQDTWLADLLGDRPVLALDGDTLTLATDTYQVVWTDEETVNPDQALEGPTWVVTGLLSGSEETGAVSSVPEGVTATLVFADGRLSGNDGCNALTGRYEVDGDQVTVSNLGHTLKGCTGGAQEVESHVLSVLAQPMAYAIDGDQLALVGAGQGLYLTVR